MLSFNSTVEILFIGFLVFLYGGCYQGKVIFFRDDSPSQEERILRWEKERRVITIDFMKMGSGNCFETYERIALKKFSNAIALRQNGFWVPYLYFDQAKGAIYGSGYSNYTCYVKNQLFWTTDDGFTLVQERQDLDGDIDLFYIQYSNDLIPISIKKFGGEIIYQRGEEVHNPKICVD